MNIDELYKKVIEIGIENDPRGKDSVLAELDSRKKDYDSLKKTGSFLMKRHSLTHIQIQECYFQAQIRQR